MKQEQGEPYEEQKAGEIVALVEGQGPKRHPIAKDKNHAERGAGEFEEESREGWKGSGAWLCRDFASKCFAEKRASKQHDAAKAKNAAKNIGAGGDDGAAGKMEDAGGPVLNSCGNEGREEHAEVGIPGDRGEFNGGIGMRSDEISGVPDEAREFILANEDERVGLKRRRNEVEKILGGDAMRGLHGRGGNGDNARGANFGRDAQSDVAAHGVAYEHRVVRKNQSACGKAAHKGTRAGFSLVRRKGPVGAAVAGKIGDVDTEALRREASRKIGHADFVSGEAVKKNDGAALRICGEAGLLDGVHGERAGAGVHQVVTHREPTRGIQSKGRAEKDENNAGGSEKPFFVFHSEGRLREQGRERA